jgi:hypothetical protein
MSRSNFGRAVALVAAYAVALQALLAAFALPVDPKLATLCSATGANVAQPAGSDLVWPCVSPCTMLGCAPPIGTAPAAGVALTASRIGSRVEGAVADGPILARTAAFGPQIPRAPPAV